MDTSLERIAFDMIKEMGFVKPKGAAINNDKMVEEVDRVIELYQHVLEKIKGDPGTNRQ